MVVNRGPSFVVQYLATLSNLAMDIDSLERIDANRSRKLGQNDANRGRKLLKWCKFRLEITENRAEMMQIGPNFASMSALRSSPKDGHHHPLISSP